MIIANGEKIMAAEIAQKQKIDNNGWDSYDGRNHQWYSLYCIPRKNGKLSYMLDANNSGNCYGDYTTKYFGCAKDFLVYCNALERSVAELLGNIDENNDFFMAACKDLIP